MGISERKRVAVEFNKKCKKKEKKKKKKKKKKTTEKVMNWRRCCDCLERMTDQGWLRK
jgi:hypothetical protein